MRLVASCTMIAVVALLVANCGTQAPILSQVPTQTQSFPVDYQRLAECSYERLLTDYESMLKKADLPSSKTIKISADGSGVRYWDLVFTSQASKRTQVSLSSVNTMWGPDTITSGKVFPAVVACAQSLS